MINFQYQVTFIKNSIISSASFHLCYLLNKKNKNNKKSSLVCLPACKLIPRLHLLKQFPVPFHLLLMAQLLNKTYIISRLFLSLLQVLVTVRNRRAVVDDLVALLLLLINQSLSFVYRLLCQSVLW
jgi:hypothetical protein